MQRIDVEVVTRPIRYELVIGTDLFGKIAKDLSEKPLGKRYAIITDTQVDAFWSQKLASALAQEGLMGDVIVFKEGEQSKNRQVKEFLEDELLKRHYNRDGAILALGGGVVGDMAGFVAATYMRSIPVVQIPTTTLSMADSSIGGKTAVDTPYGKNLIGAFHHPSVVYMDMKTLNTLDARNYYSGLSELLKHGFIWDPSILDFTDEHEEGIKKRDTAVLEELFTRNCRVKNAVVSQDDRERGLRQILNYGHTMGHAVETMMEYHLQHGECVSIGIAFAARLGAFLGTCSQEWALRQIETLRKLKLPTELPNGKHGHPVASRLLRFMQMDKKTRDGEIRFVLPTDRALQGEKNCALVDYGVAVSEAVLTEMIEKVGGVDYDFCPGERSAVSTERPTEE